MAEVSERFEESFKEKGNGGDAIDEAIRQTPLQDFMDEKAQTNPQIPVRRAINTPRVPATNMAKAAPPTRPEPSREAVQEKYQRKFGLGIVVGKFDKAYRNTKAYADVADFWIAVIAMSTSLPLYFLFLQPSWASGAQAFTFGSLYVMLPYDIIPDGTYLIGIHIGMLDNILFGFVPMAAGIYAMNEAHKKDPDPVFWLLPFFTFSFLLAVGAHFFKRCASARTIFLGVFAMVSQAILAISMLPNVTHATGVALYGVFFIYNLLPNLHDSK